MDITAFELRLSRLVDRGIIDKFLSAKIIGVFCDEEQKRDFILNNVTKIETLDDEDTDFFVKLNLYINEILY